MSKVNFFALLQALQQSRIDFILVGGLAAVLHGVPIQTYDVDLVYSRNPDNIERLLLVLAQIEAIFRIQPSRRLKPTASHLSGSGHLNLLTRFGPLDLRATIGESLRYEDLLLSSFNMRINDDLAIRVLDLETLIQIKEQLGGEKDRAVLPVLRNTLNERKTN